MRVVPNEMMESGLVHVQASTIFSFAGCYHFHSLPTTTLSLRREQEGEPNEHVYAPFYLLHFDFLMLGIVEEPLT